MSEEEKFEIGVKALFVNSKRDLLLLRAGEEELKYTHKDFWDLPGGRIQVGSDIRETLVREVEEELGLLEKDFKIESIFDAAISNFKITRSESTLSLMLIVYRCRLLNQKKFVLSNEHSEYRWVSIDEAQSMLEVKFPKPFIESLDRLKQQR